MIFLGARHCCVPTLTFTHKSLMTTTPLPIAAAITEAKGKFGKIQAFWQWLLVESSFRLEQTVGKDTNLLVMELGLA